MRYLGGPPKFYNELGLRKVPLNSLGKLPFISTSKNPHIQVFKSQ